MSADTLYVVTCIFNPLQWGTRIKHYRAFRDHMLESPNVRLITVECAFGHRPFQLEDTDPRVTHIGVRARSLAWNKENLINIGLQRGLPRDARYIAWVDADVTFRNPKWAEQTIEALQHYPVVQPWSMAIDLGPNGEPMLIKGSHVQTAFAKVWHELESIDNWLKQTQGARPLDYPYPHPGYAWAARREVLEATGGLIEASGLGAGDHQQAMAFIGHIDKAVHSETTPQYQHVIRSWAERAYSVVKGNINAVTGVIEHNFHGAKDKRKYVERWDTLIEHKFDPITDVRKNLDGVFELVGNKPAMSRDFDRYFRQRDEDANILAD